jgi:hypothetical protein
MSNPFEAFNISDDEDTTVVETKVKRTHQEKRIYKQQQLEASKAPVSAPVVTESLPERTKENAKQVRNTRAPPTPQTKKLGDGHYLDRRSGTGRVYFFFNIAISKEKKVEDGEMLEILRTNSNLKSTLNRHLKKLPLKLHLLRVKNKSLLSKSQRNLKLLLLKNITRTRELRSITLSKRRLPEDQKSMLNGSKKKN